MKIAYCISAYTDAPQLKRLVDSLGKDAHVFIHIDKKSDVEEFKRHLSPDSGNIHYVEPIKIRWATISQVEYQIRMLQAAIGSPVRFDYLFMLSAFDYPLWSNERITGYLRQHQGREYLAGIQVQSTFYLKDLQREYHPDFEKAWLPDSLNHLIRGGLRHVARLAGFRKPAQVTLANGSRYDVYKGSDYFCITRELAEYVVEQYHKHPEIKKYFTNTFAPSETLVHTIAFNSRFRDNCIAIKGPYQGLASLTPLHYLEGCNIKILDESDFTKLIQSGKMFARKFRTAKSEGLIRMLEKYKKEDK